jgi:hypothetical protein
VIVTSPLSSLYAAVDAKVTGEPPDRVVGVVAPVPAVFAKDMGVAMSAMVASVNMELYVAPFVLTAQMLVANVRVYVWSLSKPVIVSVGRACVATVSPQVDNKGTSGLKYTVIVLLAHGYVELCWIECAMQPGFTVLR